ncbi:MAG: hypothetical protein MJB14_19825 [Spirochaetes bacterium]|nr:hypothetical protein [Spirochaetota bacterium]
MNELQDIKKQIDFTTREIKNGFMTIVRNEVGISHQSQIGCLGSKTIIAVYLYDINELYKVVYLSLDNKGQIIEVLHETEGVLPKLFVNEQKDAWCFLTDTISDKNLDFIVPIKNRLQYAKPKGKRQFSGNFVGILNNIVLFHDYDIYFSKSPDKILKIEFKNDKVKSQKKVKIPEPVNNKIFINQDGNMHLLARQKDKLIHRKSDLDGEIFFERIIPFDLFNTYEVICLNEKKDSKIIYTDGSKLNLSIISPDSKVNNSLIFENQSAIFNIWKPVLFDSNTSIIRFNFETGNGWIIIQNDQLIDCFIHSDYNGYKSIVTGETIEIPCNDLILSDLTKVGDNNYCVTIYPRNENPKKNNELFIVNKQI